MIDQLQQKQREKEAEIVLLKYAILEMDRKFQELEKKVKTPAVASRNVAARGGMSSTVGATRPGVSSRNTTAMNTPRGGSKAPVTATDPRQRSRTPVANKMQNSLNTSIHS